MSALRTAQNFEPHLKTKPEFRLKRRKRSPARMNLPLKRFLYRTSRNYRISRPARFAVCNHHNYAAA
jgi:hypothetical protein